MKIPFLFLLIFSAFLGTANAQLLETSKVPQTIRSVFEKRYPGISPKWELEDGKFDAEFKRDHKKVEIFFDRKGNSSEKIEADKIPTEITTYINEHYKGEKPKKIKKLITMNDEVSYTLEVHSKMLTFDSKGNFLSDKKS